MPKSKISELAVKKDTVVSSESFAQAELDASSTMTETAQRSYSAWFKAGMIFMVGALGFAILKWDETSKCIAEWFGHRDAIDSDNIIKSSEYANQVQVAVNRVTSSWFQSTSAPATTSTSSSTRSFSAGISEDFNAYSVAKVGHEQLAHFQELVPQQLASNYPKVAQSIVLTPTTVSVYDRLMALKTNSKVSKNAQLYSLQIINNNLFISRADTQALTLANLSASADGLPNSAIVFIPRDVRYGRFQIIPILGPQENFTQQQIFGGFVLFQHDGSAFAPSYNISVSNGTHLIGPFSAAVNFTDTENVPTPTDNNNTASIFAGILLGAAAFSGIGFFAYQQRKLRESVKLAAHDKKLLVKTTALKLLSYFQRAGDAKEIADYVANVEKIIEVLEKQWAVSSEAGFFNGINAEQDIMKLASTIAQTIRPYMKFQDDNGLCGFFCNKLGRLSIETIMSNASIIAESIIQTMQHCRADSRPTVVQQDASVKSSTQLATVEL